jgi:hypothetical protein
MESRLPGHEGLSFGVFAQNLFGLLLILVPLAVFAIRQTIRNAVSE